MRMAPLRCFLHRLLVLLIALFVTETALGFTAQLQTPWERYPAVAAPSRRISSSRNGKYSSSSRDRPRSDQALTAKNDDNHDSEEQHKSLKDDKQSSSNPARVFVTSHGSSSDTVDDHDASPLQMVNGAPYEQSTATRASIRSCWKPLLETCRPSNFLGVVLFHLVGVYLAIPNSKKFLPTLLKPQMMVTLLVLLGISSTSMVINDYYDMKSGVDVNKTSKPLVAGKVPMRVVREFLNLNYAVLLLLIVVMPGIATRLSAVSALMLTFWYTKHLKPMTWIKNIVCAAIMSFAPITSGSAALYLNVSGKVAVQQLLSLHNLWRLVGVLFAGFMGRELIMDCNDVVEDKRHGVHTVPAKYGRKFGAGMALVFSTLSAGLTLATPMQQGHVRQIALAGMGSAIMLWRACKVFQTDGQDHAVADKFVESGKVSILFILASFI